MYTQTENKHTRDAEMTAAVNQYKLERAKFYDDKAPAENPFTAATQTLWYQHYLHKKRLQRSDIKICYNRVAETRMQPAGRSGYPHFFYKDDGKHTVCHVVDTADYKATWQRQGKLLLTQNTYGLRHEYYILSSKAAGKNSYVCPNCGNISTIEKMVDGCDYCGTKFRLEDFTGKVASFYLNQKGNLSTGRDRNPVYLIGIIAFLVACIPLFSIVTFTRTGAAGGLSLSPILIAAIIVGGAFILGKSSEKHGAGRTTAVTQRVKEEDPLFSKEFFIGNLMNKLQSIHYAGSTEEVRAFFEPETNISIPDYSNVVCCELLDYAIMDFRKEGALQCIDCEVNLQLRYDEESALRTAKERLRVTLVKNAETQTDAVHDAIVYRCASCGSSLTLLNGGHCEHCGNNLKLIDYDWVLRRYQVV